MRAHEYLPKVLDLVLLEGEFLSDGVTVFLNQGRLADNVTTLTRARQENTETGEIESVVLIGKIDGTAAAGMTGIIWSVDGNQRPDSLDHDILNLGGTVFFEIECRIPILPLEEIENDTDLPVIAAGPPREQSLALPNRNDITAAYTAAQNLAEDILERLNRDDAITHILAQYDEPPDPSQYRQRAVSHVLAIGLRGSGLPDPGAIRAAPAVVIPDIPIVPPPPLLLGGAFTTGFSRGFDRAD